MTPKNKAQEIFDKMKLVGDEDGNFTYDSSALNSSLITVDELIESTLPEYQLDFGDSFYEGYNSKEYWLEVKQEIEKL